MKNGKDLSYTGLTDNEAYKIATVIHRESPIYPLKIGYD